MRRGLFLLTILSLPVLAALALASQSPSQKPPTAKPAPPKVERIKPEQLEMQIQKASVEFTEPVKLLGAILKGTYLFVHDEAKMSRGEPCTWVYGRGETGKFDKLVVSFHCIPVQRDEPAEQFKVFISGALSPFTVPELLEYRFAGSTEGHLVPKAE